jgi:hypothetical protein
MGWMGLEEWFVFCMLAIGVGENLGAIYWDRLEACPTD